ncbi:helix-turn-helix domain-containing protein [Streptomonospora sp. PA3]|uniref:helix-turn-helix domain-containing protein n=1 Tax=Streptomonospora sp. PA3 TaxID=2607326 RepID=UPI0012DC2283|nr:helix-turn-helix transcriptional regulator [Streptomonospora sp. PA3]MUL39779.1 helix-turn-helix domain-containing protein [Streptomonospora sp. PA3]
MTEVNRELADFLRRARSKADPERAGLPADGRVRRVPGLRREEVAMLAGVSTDYYTRLEQGRRITPSAGVINGIAHALGLDDAGRLHLVHLIGAAGRPSRRPTAAQRIRPGLRLLLDTFHSHPALILGRRTDVLACNRLARALFTDFEAMRPRERNYSRWMFLDGAARELFVDWEQHARNCVEALRLESGRDPGDEPTRALVADLCKRSPEFQAWWDDHGVYQRTFGEKRLRHPLVGELTVHYETLTTTGDSDQTLFLYTAEQGTPSQEALALLASWTATAPPQPA